jgi:hypothetical protein
MPRRHHGNVDRGEVYCSEWPEWHVDCAVEHCQDHVCLAGPGECWKWQEAESKFHEDGTDGWTKHKGRWYCPAHKPT